MDGYLTEINQKIIQNIKNLSYVKYRKKIFDRMRSMKDTRFNLKKKIFSASYKTLNLKEKKSKLILKSKSCIRHNILSPYPERNNHTSILYSKKLDTKKNTQSFFYKKRDETSTSLSSLMKTSTSFFNTTNFNFKSTKRHLFLNSATNSNNNNIFENNYEKTFTYLFNISFDKNVSDFLKDVKVYPNEDSFCKFNESIRLMRKAKYKNYLVNQKIKDIESIKLEEINSYKELEFKYKARQKLFLIYNDCLRRYLQELSNIRRRELDNLAELEAEEENIKKNIEKLIINFNQLKEKIANLKDIKKFLIQVKFGKKIDKIPNEIKKEYGFIIEENKGKETRKSQMKSIPKNLNNSDLFRKRLFSIFNSKRKKSVKMKKVISKSEKNINKEIFESVEEFQNYFDEKSDKINENLLLYWDKVLSTNEYKYEKNKIIKDYDRYMKIFLPEEEKLIKIVTYRKKMNIMLTNKLNNLIETNKTETNSLRNIANKLQKIILNIESKIDIRKYIKEKNLKIFLESQDEIFNNDAETLKKAKYIMKVIEMISEVLITKKNIYKNDTDLNENYKKIQFEIERSNNYDRYKMQLSFASEKNEAKIKDVINRITKVRICSVLQNRKRCVEEQVPDKVLLKRRLANKKIKKYSNKYEEAKDLFSY